MSNLRDFPVPPIKPFSVTNFKLGRKLEMRAHRKLWEAGIYNGIGFWDATHGEFVNVLAADEMFGVIINTPGWCEMIGGNEEEYRMAQLFFALFFVSETQQITGTNYLDDLRMNFAADTLIV